MVIVKWTETDPLPSLGTELDVLRDERNEVGGLAHSFDVRSITHSDPAVTWLLIAPSVTLFLSTVPVAAAMPQCILKTYRDPSSGPDLKFCGLGTHGGGVWTFLRRAGNWSRLGVCRRYRSVKSMRATLAVNQIAVFFGPFVPSRLFRSPQASF